MGFNKFYLVIVFRVVLIVITGVLLSFFMSQDDKIMTSIISFIFLLLQTIALIAYINKTNRSLADFLLRIQSKDTAFNYRDHQTLKSFKGLNLSFDHINKELQRIRIENEQQTHYLNTIVENARIGIIAFDDKGKIELFNPEAASILKCDNCKFMTTLAEKLPDFYREINEQATQKSQLLKIKLKSEILTLAIKKTRINIEQKSIHIISFQNIKRELDHKELESWQNLIKVLNHEITNSLTPITTLSKVINRYIHRDNQIIKAAELNDEMIEDISINAKVIEERANALMDFIEVYKNITKNPTLHLSKFKIEHCIQKIRNFYNKNFMDQKINFEIKIDNELMLYADEALIEQLLINLIKNSMEALVHQENKKIEINATQSGDGNPIVEITDNGIGIPEEELDKVFIPFYSTKENGSGIGLSLARQIMYLHQGSISVQSVPDKETRFTLKF